MLTALFLGGVFVCVKFLNSELEKFSEFGSFFGVEVADGREEEDVDAIKVEGISRRYAHTAQLVFVSD